VSTNGGYFFELSNDSISQHTSSIFTHSSNSLNMTAQKGFFNRVSNHSVYPIDESPIRNQQQQLPNSKSRSRQRLISALIILAGILLLLIIVAVVAFTCWKSVAKRCETCDIEAEKSSDNAYSKSGFVNAPWLYGADDDAPSTKTTSPTTTTTSVKLETSVRAPPPRPIVQTIPRKDDTNEDRQPWYARLPLIGWMFRESETTEETIVTKISFS